jgi:putative heme-binding domain-containing protein
VPTTHTQQSACSACGRSSRLRKKRAGLGQLSATRAGGAAVVQAVKSGAISKTDLDGPTVEKLQAVIGEDAGVAELLREMAVLFRPVLALDGSGEAFTEPGISLDGPFTVETWVRLEPSISNEDGILGAPGVLDMNFYNSVFRVWIGDGASDAVVARKPIAHGVWTHLAVTRDESGFFKIYMDGVLESDTSKAAPQKFEQLRIGWTQMGTGTAGALNEFRVWNRARSASEIVATIDRSFAAADRPEGLVFLASGDEGWGKPHTGAKTIRTNNLPPLLAADEAASLDEKYTRYSALAEQPGDLQRGRLAAAMCYACHLINGEGANIGPNLSGVGAMGTEAILRNILMPNAAMEGGYRIYRVELKSGDLVEGFFASEDADAVLVRVPGGEERRVPKKEIRDATYLRRSLMPEGLLDAMSPQQVSDLFAFLKSLH